jgi:phenylalanyl-tRNA synthetase beta chain
MHPTRSAYLSVNDEIVGFFGELMPQLADKLDIDKKAYVGEIKFDELKKHFNDKIVFKQISKFPTIERDLAIIVDDKITCADIVDVITQAGGKYLESVKLFDVYKGGQISSDKKSLAFNLLFNAPDKTLSVEEIDQAINKILKRLRENVGAELR